MLSSAEFTVTVLTGGSLLLGIWLFVNRECYWITNHSIPHNVRVGDDKTSQRVFCTEETYSSEVGNGEDEDVEGKAELRILEVIAVQYLHIEGTTEPLYEIQ